jgi:hypothetical protein
MHQVGSTNNVVELVPLHIGVLNEVDGRDGKQEMEVA